MGTRRKAANKQTGTSISRGSLLQSALTYVSTSTSFVESTNADILLILVASLRWKEIFYFMIKICTTIFWPIRSSNSDRELVFYEINYKDGNRMVAAAAARLLSRPDQIGAVFSTIPSRRPTKSKRAETMSIRGADRNKKQLHSQVIHNMIRTHTHTINDKWAGYITTGTTTATSATGLLGRETGRTSQENRHFFIFFFYILFLDFSCFFFVIFLLSWWRRKHHSKSFSRSLSRSLTTKLSIHSPPLPEKDCRSPDQIDYHHTFTAFTINITIINRNINSGNNGENDQQKKIHSFSPTKLRFLLLAILFNLKRLAPIAGAARGEGEAWWNLKKNWRSRWTKQTKLKTI